MQPRCLVLHCRLFPSYLTGNLSCLMGLQMCSIAEWQHATGCMDAQMHDANELLVGYLPIRS